MFNFRQVTLFCILSALTFVSSKAMAVVPSSELSMSTIPASELNRKIERIYQKSLSAAGTPEQMDKRAMVLYHLYNDSNKEFSFALSVSHLTLAIERSTSAPRFTNILNLIQMQETAKGWIQWGDGLKKINQEMVQRLHFAYFVSKLMYNTGTTLEQIEEALPQSENAKLLSEFIQDTLELYPLFALVHEGGIEFWDKKNMAAAFARWEHQTIIQHRIEALYEKMPGLIQFAVRNVPGTGVEFFLKALQIRTTLGLQCLSPFKSLRTKDFIDVDIRINQSSNFHNLLANNAFDPDNECFKDPYYTTHFPKRFHAEPEKFSRWYYDFITKDEVDGFANNTERWLQKAYRNVPVVEMATLPSLEIPIASYHKEALAMDLDPLTRNDDINRDYYELSDRLMSCMGFSKKEPFANWYHYAYWASKSARKVISGDFFIEQDVAMKIGANLASFFGLFQKPTMQAIFARTNNLIALEMLPLGQEFYYQYCVQNKEDFSEFSAKLRTEESHDRLLVEAFQHYFLAIKEKDLKKKKEHVALATTLQVISEQIRIDDNIKEAFRYNGSIHLAEYMFHKMATQVGALSLNYGQKHPRKSPFLRSGRISAGKYSRDIKEIFNGTQMHLGYDVRTALTDRDLLNITLPQYQNLLNEFDLEVDVRKIHKYKKTGVANWAHLGDRLRHLIAQFRTNMSNEHLFQSPLQLQSATTQK